MRHASDAMNFEYEGDVLAGGPLRVVDGEMAVPQAAGLGAELDEAAIARWELTEERKRDLDAYWQELKGVIGTSYPSQDHLVRHCEPDCVLRPGADVVPTRLSLFVIAGA